MKHKVYISGPMTGIPQHNFPLFNMVAAALREKGLDVVNPAELNPTPGRPWSDCLRTDIKALCDCDALLLLPGWQRSEGAQLEQLIAFRLGMPIQVWGEMDVQS